ncbi:glycerate kinase, partial [Streptococcus suis]
LSATKVAEAIKKGFSKVFPQAGYDLIPLGDGGEGPVESLMQALSVDGTQTWVTGPLGDNIKVSYAGQDDLAVFELGEMGGVASIPP